MGQRLVDVRVVVLNGPLQGLNERFTSKGLFGNQSPSDRAYSNTIHEDDDWPRVAN